MLWRAICGVALLAAIGTSVRANDEEPDAAAAAAGDYYSETKPQNCFDSAICVVAHAKVPKGKVLTVTHASCGVGHKSSLIGLTLTRNASKAVPSGDSGTPLVILEKPASGVLADGSVSLSGYNQDVSYRIKAGLFPIMYAQQQTAGFLSLACILTGKLS